MKKISIYNKREDKQIREKITTLLKENGFFTSRNGELMVIMGGDGLFMSAIRSRIEENQIPIFVGLNAGNLGFFSEFSIDNMELFIDILKKKDYWIQKIPVYEVTITEKNKTEHKEYFINDFVLKTKSANAIHSLLKVDHHTFCRTSGDGIIVSSSIGSTGYNASNHGAMIPENLPLLQIGFLAPINSKQFKSPTNSIVLHHKHHITIQPNFKVRRPAFLSVDTKEIKTKHIKKIEIQKSEKEIHILRSKQFSNLANVKHKMDFPE